MSKTRFLAALRCPAVCLVISLLFLVGCLKSDSDKTATPTRPRQGHAQKDRAGTANAARKTAAPKSEESDGATAKPVGNFHREQPAAETPAAAVPANRTEPAPVFERPRDSRPLPKPQVTRNPVPVNRNLTAGSVDDVNDSAVFLTFLARNGRRRDLQRVLRLELLTPQGAPVNDAEVALFPADEAADGPVLVVRTRANGRAAFVLDATRDRECRTAATFPRKPLPPQASPFSPGQCRYRVRIRHRHLATDEWVGLTGSDPASPAEPEVVELPLNNGSPPAGLDVCIVLDTTSSMSDELSYLQTELRVISKRLQEQFPHVAQRHALICYRDEDDVYVTRNFDFTPSIDKFGKTLADQDADGGGDYPEAVHLALEKAGQLSWRKGAVARVVLLVGDAPPHDRHQRRAETAVQKLAERGIAVYPLAGSGTQPECELFFRQQAARTGGKYLFLTDHSDIGGAHGRPQSPKYDVETLNQLLLRLLAGEITGQPPIAREVIATEESDGHGSRVPVEQQQHAHPQSVLPQVHVQSHHDLPPTPHPPQMYHCWSEEKVWYKEPEARIGIGLLLVLVIFGIDFCMKRAV